MDPTIRGIMCLSENIYSLSVKIQLLLGTKFVCESREKKRAVMHKFRNSNLFRPTVVQQIGLVARYSYFAVETRRLDHSKIDANRLLNALSKCGRIDEARQMFDKMLERDDFAWNTMISGYANLGRFDEARQLFHETPLKSSITWSSLISGYCKYDCEDEVLELFLQMQFEGQRPNQYTLGSVLRLCSTMGLLEKGEQIHGYATKTRLDMDVFVATGLVDVYAKCNCILEAENLFQTVAHSKHHVLWSAMLSGYSWPGSLRLYD